jgi:hypothetical protein
MEPLLVFGLLLLLAALRRTPRDRVGSAATNEPMERIPRPPPSGTAIARRLGWFTVQDALWYGIAHNGEGLAILDRMAVIDAVRDPCSMHWRIRAVHPDFDRVGYGEVIPEYVAEFRAGEGFPRWTRVKP